MNPTNQEIFKRIDALAEKLGLAANHIWSVYVRQSYVEGITDSIFVILAIVIICLCFFGIKYAANTDSDYEVAIMITSVIMMVVAVIVLICCVVSIPTELFNPDYFAFHRIMESIK